MNDYLKNLNKIEFAVTYACTGRCKHCSEGEHLSCGESIDPTAAVRALREISEVYGIKTVMAFGGEPLLCCDTVCAIMSAASERGIACRQVITNGYFSKSRDKIREAAQRLAESGVNDLLLSVDAFHQETIPLDTVKIFAVESVACGIPVRLQPAWLVSEAECNPYNEKTREILARFSDLGIAVGTGNIIFPEGNARKYLAEYFLDNEPVNPYVEDPCDLRCLSFSPNGDLLNSNIYRESAMEIIKNYTP